jgi:hypothetical protein
MKNEMKKNLLIFYFFSSLLKERGLNLTNNKIEKNLIL